MEKVVLDFLIERLFDSAFVALFFGFLWLLFRETVTKFFTQSIELNFSKKLEEAKSEIREKELKIEAELAAREGELSRISDFLATMKMNRSTAVQQKRMEAAEAAFRSLSTLASMTIAVEMVKLMKTDVISKSASDPKIQAAFTQLVFRV